MKTIPSGLLIGLAAFLGGVGLTVAASAGASSPCRPVDAIYLELDSHQVDGVDTTRVPANPLREVSAIYGGEHVFVNQTDESQPYAQRSIVMRPETR